MKATLKVNAPDNYSAPRKYEVPMNQHERKEYRRKHRDATEEDLINIVNEPRYYGRAGDEVKIISDNPGAWQICIVVENKKGERFSILWTDLNIEDGTAK